MIVSSIFSVRTAASVAHMSFEYKCLHKQLVQPRDRLVMNGFICLSHTCSLHTEKFREIYNFAFAWAREKVWHLLCTLFMKLYQNICFIHILKTYIDNILCLILQGQKSLALETAIGMWRLLFAERNWPLIDYWCQFLQVYTSLFQQLIAKVFFPCCDKFIEFVFTCSNLLVSGKAQ